MPSVASKIFNLYGKYIVRIKQNGVERWSKPQRDVKAFEVPRKFHKKYDVHRKVIKGRRVITLTPKSYITNKHIVYFHGGAYAAEIVIWHWLFMGNLIDQSGCRITAIEYPLTPEHTHVETFEMVKSAYLTITKDSNEDFYFAGDSAGGGLSLAFAQLVQKENLAPKPMKLALISPWVDVNRVVPIPEELDKKDLIISEAALKVGGESYAGEKGDTKHFLVSPLYGSFKDLPEIGIWMGTHDILSLDMPRFKEKLDQEKIPYQYFEAKEMQHVYPIFPIPEGRQAVKEISEFILS